MILFLNLIDFFNAIPEMLSSTKINRLSKIAGHQLEAEQVIPDLSSAIKELIENSLDSIPSSISTAENLIQSFLIVI